MDRRHVNAADSLLASSEHIRYVAIRHNGQLALRERSGIDNASASESDKYEEMIVNPTLLTLVTQRGDIDCGGAEFVLIRYGNFFQFVTPIVGGHLSIGMEPSCDPLAVVDAALPVLRGHDMEIPQLK